MPPAQPPSTCPLGLCPPSSSHTDGPVSQVLSALGVTLPCPVLLHPSPLPQPPAPVPSPSPLPLSPPPAPCPRPPPGALSWLLFRTFCAPLWGLQGPQSCPGPFSGAAAPSLAAWVLMNSLPGGLGQDTGAWGPASFPPQRTPPHPSASAPGALGPPPCPPRPPGPGFGQEGNVVTGDAQAPDKPDEFPPQVCSALPSVL